MSDVFDESEDLKNAKSLAEFLRNEYNKIFNGSSISPMDIDELRIRSRLANNWPGSEVVVQIIRDVAQVMRANGIKPEDIK